MSLRAFILRCRGEPSRSSSDGKRSDALLKSGCDLKTGVFGLWGHYFRVQSKREFIVAKPYQSIDESNRIRLEVLKRFLTHYRSAFPLGRYVCPALPDLPFVDQSFGITLCGHLLLIYSSLFDLDFLYRSIRELCRVSRKEVRVHPTVDSSGMKYGKLSEFRERIDDLGSATQILDVDHEFFRGTNQTLRILVNLK